MPWMIYGANGYSARLIAAEAVKRGLKPVLAARNPDKLRSVAQEHQLDYRAFSLDDTDAAVAALKDIDAVIHCAGPFSATSAAMIDACLQSQTHYFDITGEIDVFEHALSDKINQQAEDAGIIVCPGVGFDVIPTDCIALTLANTMPDADTLSLGFDSSVSVSPGTAKTTVEGMSLGSKTRINGKIQPCSVAHKTRKIDFGRGEKLAMTIPWGDISTAYKTTGIPNINVYIPTKAAAVPFIRLSRFLQPLLGIGFVQSASKKRIDKKITGPSDSARARKRGWVWGEVTNSSGQIKQAFVETANPYDVTAYGPLAIIEALPMLSGKKGSTTPALLMGAGFVSRLPDSSEIRIA